MKGTAFTVVIPTTEVNEILFPRLQSKYKLLFFNYVNFTRCGCTLIILSDLGETKEAAEFP